MAEQVKPQMDKVLSHDFHIMQNTKTPLQERIAAIVDAAMQANPDISTQQKLAARAGVAQSHVSRLLRGQNITVEVLEAVAKAIGKQPFELIMTDADKTIILSRIFGGQPPNERANNPFPENPLPPKRRAANTKE